MGAQIGAITEQGDLGLGFDILNEQDQNKYNKNESVKNSEKEDKKDK